MRGDFKEVHIIQVFHFNSVHRFQLGMETPISLPETELQDTTDRSQCYSTGFAKAPKPACFYWEKKIASTDEVNMREVKFEHTQNLFG